MSSVDDAWLDQRWKEWATTAECTACIRQPGPQWHWVGHGSSVTHCAHHKAIGDTILAYYGPLLIAERKARDAEIDKNCKCVWMPGQEYYRYCDADWAKPQIQCAWHAARQAEKVTG